MAATKYIFVLYKMIRTVLKICPIFYSKSHGKSYENVRNFLSTTTNSSQPYPNVRLIFHQVQLNDPLAIPIHEKH